MRILTPFLVAGAMLSGSAFAQTLSPTSATTNTAFRALSEDLGAALSYKGMIPSEPLGIIGFDIGVAVSQTKLANASKYGAAFDNETSIYLPTVRAHKGLPFGIDVGVAYSKVPDSNIKYVGGELRYALMDGGITMPAIAVRGSMSKLSGVDDLDFSTKGLDISISKGFLMLTPYLGVGKVWVNSDAKFTAPVIDNQSFSMNKSYVGLGINLLLVNLNIEADKTGDATSYSAKVGLRF